MERTLALSFGAGTKVEEWIDNLALRLLGDPAEGENGVKSAESKGIRKRAFDLRGTRLVRDDIEIAGGIAFEEIRRRRQEIAAESKQGRHSFQCSGRAERVAMHGFCRTNRKLVSVGSKHLPDCACFSRIIRLCPGPVRVHVIDLFSRKMPVLECGVHGASRAFSEWASEMISVSRHAEASKFCVNFRPARACVLQCFENQHGCA